MIIKLLVNYTNVSRGRKSIKPFCCPSCYMMLNSKLYPCTTNIYLNGYISIDFSRILKVHWNDFITNIEVADSALAINVKMMLLKVQLQWVGQVARMKNQSLPGINSAKWFLGKWGYTEKTEEILEKDLHLLWTQPPSVRNRWGR